MTRCDAKRAGRALFDVTQPQRQRPPHARRPRRFETLSREHAELREALPSPFVPADAKVGIVAQVTARSASRRRRGTRC